MVRRIGGNVLTKCRCICSHRQPKAIAIYREMRRLERENYGPSCDPNSKWWAMNQELARCFGLYEGMFVYEDPEWESERPMETGIEMFHRLEIAARKPKNGYRHKRQK